MHSGYDHCDTNHYTPSPTSGGKLRRLHGCYDHQEFFPIRIAVNSDKSYVLKAQVTLGLQNSDPCSTTTTNQIPHITVLSDNLFCVVVTPQINGIVPSRKSKPDSCRLKMIPGWHNPPKITKNTGYTECHLVTMPTVSVPALRSVAFPVNVHLEKRKSGTAHNRMAKRRTILHSYAHFDDWK